MGVTMADIAARVPAEVTELESRARRIETPCGDGVMVWRLWGEGEPLVLAHGGSGAWHHWIRNVPELALERMVMVPDLPGFGDSAMLPSIDHATMAATLAEGVSRIAGSGKAVDMAGFSFGGVCLGNLAALRPEVVRRLVLVDTGGLDTPFGGVDIGSVRGLDGDALIERLRGNLLGLMLRHRESADDCAIWQLAHNGKRARIAAEDFVIPDQLLTALPRVQAPVAAIWGEFDQPHPAPDLQEAAIRSAHPQLEFRVIEGAGHWAMYERPDAFNAALLGLLAKLDWA